MAMDFIRCRQIVQAQMANYPYLKDNVAFQLIGSIMANRRKEVHITADFASALHRCAIPLEQQRGYAQVAADYFNQKGHLIKNGSAYGMYPRPSKKLKHHAKK